MNRNAQSLLLVAAGGVLIWITVDGTYVRYVRESALPWILSSAIALVVIGLVLLWADNEAKLAARVLGEAELARRAAPVHEHADDDHGHGRMSGMVPWLLVVPLLALFLVQPRELGAYTAERTSSKSVEKPADEYAYGPLVGNDPVEVPLIELNQRAVYGGEKTLTGRTLLVSGFVTKRADSETGEFYVNRLFIACCAADALPVRVHITGAPQAYKTETWVQITGRYVGNESFPDPNLDPLPTIEVDSIKRIAVPDEPYAT
ncbi:MAG: TIGR03943 family protein [Streptosporangiales bacterium]|nr:TIGR03943 family protein [Streptosporangiales bacterium]